MKFTFPWFATGIGIVLAIVLMRSGALSAGKELSLPLLTLLFISEFGFIVTAVGGVVAGKTLLQSGRSWNNLLLTVTCIFLSVAFFTIGILLWTGQVSQ
ncbi:MAG: hypothetical protein KZQ80_16430 [Candidatus Thiodiazotropha sp. (ex Monitilora ramsayi)]|nr:hypothetical protein [Candidatus Thiodiazotropha sp. (ex Monitilora ramsayi)]